ncbi:MAG: hypothetical protein WA982_17995 [Rubrobacteraceae bacterium]
MSTLPRDGFAGRGQGTRRKPLIIGGVVLALIAIWSYGVLSYGGGEQAKSTSPKDGGATTEQTAASAVPDEPAYAEGGSTNGSGGGSTGGTATGADNTEGQSSGDSGNRDDETAGGAQQEPSPAGGQQPAQHNHPVGAANEPGNYDPLGTGASEGDLAPIDEERLRFAAGNYISAAYGYSGDDKDAYNQGVGATVVWPDFFDSEGSSETERYAEQVKESGTKSGAVLTEFETLEITEDRATAYAYFKTGSGYASDGSLTGETQAYRQKMTLARTGATWKVLGVEKIEEVN